MDAAHLLALLLRTSVVLLVFALALEGRPRDLAWRRARRAVSALG
jgi:hypothetical protein